MSIIIPIAVPEIHPGGEYLLLIITYIVTNSISEYVVVSCDTINSNTDSDSLNPSDLTHGDSDVVISKITVIKAGGINPVFFGVHVSGLGGSFLAKPRCRRHRN